MKQVRPLLSDNHTGPLGDDEFTRKRVERWKREMDEKYGLNEFIKKMGWDKYPPFKPRQ